MFLSREKKVIGAPIISIAFVKSDSTGTIALVRISPLISGLRVRSITA